jgi:hypothetical protein
METVRLAESTEQASEALPAQPDWWDAGRGAPRNATQVAPPVVIYATRDRERNPVLSSLTVAAGGTAMLMSALPWVTANFQHHVTRVWGTSPLITHAIASNGWLTFTGGATLVFMGLLMLASSVFALRIITTLLAAITSGIAAYDTVRLVQKLHDAQHAVGRTGVLATHLAGHLQLGYGIIVVLCVSFVALIASAMQLSRS